MNPNCRRFISVVCFIVCCASIMAQLKRDSLWSTYRSPSSSDEQKLEVIYDLFDNNWVPYHPDTFIAYGTEMQELARQNGSVDLEAVALMNTGAGLAIANDYDGADSCYRRALSMFTISTPELKKAKVWMNQGLVLAGRGLHAEAKDLYERSLEVAKREKDKVFQAMILSNLGNIYNQMGDLATAIEMYTIALQLNEQMEESGNIGISLNNIGMCYGMLGEMEKARGYFRRAVEVYKRYGQAHNLPRPLMNLANSYAVSDPDSAFFYVDQAIAATIPTKDKQMRAMCLGLKSHLFRMQGMFDSIFHYQLQAAELARDANDIQFVLRAELDLASILADQGRIAEAIAKAEEIQAMGAAAGDIQFQLRASDLLHQMHRSAGNHQKALAAYVRYVNFKDSLASEENQRETFRQEYRYSYEKQAMADSLEFAQKEAVKDLEIEKRDADLAKQRIALAATGGGIVLLFLLAYSIRKGKKRSDELLHNILPEEVATELKEKGKVGSKRIESVTVLFTDFKGFTAMAEKLSPKELVEDLNVCFSEFDGIMEKYGIEKIKTIGDAYMAAGGLPLPDEKHAQHVIQAALEMRNFVEAGKAKKIEAGLPYFEIRIGVHTGPVVAGIVGVKKFQYDIWGDTVNTASRMESSGEVGQVNISEGTYELVKDEPGFSFTPRGKVQAKGKGEMEMYFVSKT